MKNSKSKSRTRAAPKRRRDANDPLTILEFDDADGQDYARQRQRRKTLRESAQETAQILSLPGPARKGRSTFVEDAADDLGEHVNTTPDIYESFLDTFEIADYEDLPELLDAPQAGARTQEEKSRKEEMGRKRANKLHEWLPYRSSFLDELLRLERVPQDAQCYSCMAHDALYRCIECFGSPLLCRSCIVGQHKNLPLHRVESCARGFWDKISLRSLGLEVQLGHCGLDCKLPSEKKSLVVYKTNGFHLVEVVYCGCNHRSELWQKRNQLLGVRWYPATTTDPSTAFTFAMLDQFHELTVQGKTSAHDYYQGLAHMSDNAGLRGLPKRYDEFLRVSRCYRHLTLTKRAGRGHDPNGVEKTRSGQLALECPACPHPGKNLPNDWKNSSNLWLYTLVLAIDANFRLKSKDRGVKNDALLGPGWAYFVEPNAYHEQLQLQGGKDIHKIDRDSCESTFQAMEKATTRVNDGYLVTGVGAVICARSGLVRANGVGDLQKGERYINMDYIFLSSIVGCLCTLLLVSYDIACQWNKKLRDRVNEYPLSLRTAFWAMTISYVIPKYHISAHKQACQSPYSLNYLPHSARTDGEGIERGWAHINPIAMSTREMGPGFRIETIDDHWSAWNWRKIVGLGSTLLRKLKDAEKWHAKHRKVFKDMAATFPSDTIASWDKLVKAWQKNPHGAFDPYAEPDCHVSLADLRKELAEEEENTASRGVATVKDMTASAFLLRGLELEELRRSYTVLVATSQAKPHSIQSAVLQERRTTLLSKISKWREYQWEFMPCSAIEIARAESKASGTELTDSQRKKNLLYLPPICLPSGLPAGLRATLPAQHKLASKEVRIRLAQAEDALVELRRLLRLKSNSLTFKKVNNMGQRDNTRARAVLTQFSSKIELTAERYRAAHSALAILDPGGSWMEHLKPLTKSDVRGHGEHEEEEERKRTGIPRKDAIPSQRVYEPSWIWRRLRKEEGGEAELDAGLRVEWAKAQARFERFEEEILLLIEEMRRTLAYCVWKAQWWRLQATRRIEAGYIEGHQRCIDSEESPRQFAVDFSSELACGLRAYAHKQAFIWEQLGKSFAATWFKAALTYGATSTWPQQYQFSNELVNSSSKKRTILGLMASSQPAHFTAEDETFVLDGGELHAIDKGEDDEGDVSPPESEIGSEDENDI